jgi:hypothetical protein
MMAKRLVSILCLGVLGSVALAQGLDASPSDLGPAPSAAADSAFAPDADREPASTQPLVKKRTYVGAADEEDLRVQGALPEAALKIDARSLQRDVYEQLYHQKLKEETQNDLEE